MTLSRNAIDLLTKRYVHKGESPEGIFKRVARAISVRDEKFEKELYEDMINGVFLPNSPTIRNAGRKRGMYHACLTGDTPILMADMSYKPIKYISQEDTVISHAGNPDTVTSTMTRVANIVTVKVAKLPPFTVTKDHPLLTQTGWVKVGNLVPRKHFIKIGLPHTHLLHGIDYIYIDNTSKQPYHTKKLPSKVSIDRNVMWLLGMYIAEGSITNGYDLRFSLHLDEIELAKKIQSILIDLFKLESKIKSSISPAGKCTTVRVGSTILSKWLIEQFGKGFSNKKIPEWVYTLPEDLISEFISGINEGDGCKINTYQTRITLANEYLSRQVFELCRLIKYRASLREESTRPLETQPSWSISYGATYNPGLDTGEFLRVESIIDNNEIDTVYNFETEKDHSYIANHICAHNCFILPLEDNIGSIFETIKNMAMIFKGGGGVGINFSALRPKDAPLSGGGTSSGAISFMSIFNSITETVKQGGFRRGALMGIMNPTHPEIFDFCRAKLRGALTNFNLSVMVTDEFMKKATQRKDGEIELAHDGIVYNRVRAKDVLDLITLGTWVSGDPAILFFDRINKDNKLWPKIKLDATNPCQPIGSILLDGDILRPIDSVISSTWDSWPTGKKEVLELTCNNGLKLRFTPEHKILSENGYDWIPAKDSLGKQILWGLGNREVTQIDVNTVVEGFLFGDGFKCANGEGVSVKLNLDKEPEVAKLLYSYGYNLEECGSFYINKNKLFPMLTGFLNYRTYERNLPCHILFGPSNTSASFLRGLFEANGSVNKHSQISLKATNRQMVGDVQILLASFGIPSWIVPNKPTKVKWSNGTYISRESYNLQIAPRVSWIFRDKIGFISKRKNELIRDFDKEYKSKLKVVSIKNLGNMEVYDFQMKEGNPFNFCQGVIAHNCSEVSLPPYGACCLGSLNVSKFVEGDKFNFDRFYSKVKMAARALLNINIISGYPLPQIAKVMADLNPIGVGLMGFADTLIMLGVKYDSNEAMDFIEELGKPYIEATEEVAHDAFYKRIIAPTGSLSIIADCSSGIEPIYSESFQRNITIGPIIESRELYKSEYTRTAFDVSPDWHLKIQAKFQSIVDGGISKTINVPYNTSVDSIKNIYIQAWKMGVKGVTIFRDKSIEGVLKPINKCEGEVCHL